MTEQLGDDLEYDVARRYPYPLAATYYRAFRTTRGGDESHDYLLNLFEVTLKYCASIALSQYFIDAIVDPKMVHALRNIRRPSLGHWYSWLRDILELYRSKNMRLLVPELEGFCTQKDQGELLQAYTELRELMIERLQYKGGRKRGAVAPQQLFELLVDYRNRVMHAARPSRYDLDQAAGSLRVAMRGLFRRLVFTTDYQLIYLEKVERAPGSLPGSRRYHHFYFNLMGDRYYPSPQPRTLDNDDAEPMSLYLLAKGSSFSPLLSLDPFFIFQTCPRDRRDEVFVLNDSEEDNVEYISYQCAHHLRPTQSLDRIKILLDKIGILHGEVVKSQVSTIEQDQGPTRANDDIEENSLREEISRPQLGADRSGDAERQGMKDQGTLVVHAEPVLSSQSVHTRHGAMWAEYAKIGGPSSFLGLPLASAQRSSINSSQGTAYSLVEFEHGVIVLHESGPRRGQIFTTSGSIYWKYKQWGGPQGVLGLPISNEADGWSSGVTGYKCRYSLFENGIITWHAEGPYAEQSFVMYSEIATRYNSLNPNGKQGSGSFLGLPIQDQIQGATSPTGVNCGATVCEGGLIVSHLDGPLQGQAFVMRVPIWNEYRKIGGSASFLGLPVGDEHGYSASSQGTACSLVEFEHGLMCLHESGSRRGEVFTTSGSIYWKYKQWGGPQGVLGLPVRDEIDGWPSGVMGYKCRYSLFENGVIHWHAEGPHAEQSFVMHGAIANKYNGLDLSDKVGSGSFLGLPLGDQSPGATSPTGVRCEFVAFEAGGIHLHLEGNLHGQVFETHGAIWFRYVEMGGSGSWLGLPVSDEYNWEEGRRSDFEQGHIYWNGVDADAFRGSH